MGATCVLHPNIKVATGISRMNEKSNTPGMQQLYW